MAAATFTLTGDLAALVGSATKRGAYVQLDRPVTDPTNDIVYEMTSRTTVEGSFSLPTLPALNALNNSGAAFNMVVTIGSRKWLVPAQSAASTHDLTEFTETTGVVPPNPITYALRAPDYVTGRAYVVGELVTYSGTLYRITTAYTSSGGSLDLTKATAIGGGPGGAVSSVAGKTGAVTLAKADVGLGSVDNTSDAGKPVSTAQQAALDAKATLQQVATTVTASGAAVANKHNPADATAAARTISLPTGQTEGTQISVEKVDSSINTVSITGNIRGVAATTISLSYQSESLMLRADSAGSWWPIAGHRTKVSLDAVYKAPLDALTAAPTAMGVRTRAYDPTVAVYGYTATTRKAVRQALGLALAGNSLVPVMCIGDSETAGWKATPGTDDPVTKLRNQLTAAGFPVTGGWIFPGNGTTTSLDNRWTNSGLNANQTLGWVGNASTSNNYLWTAQTGAWALLTPDLPGTVAEFTVFCTTTQNVDYQIDGGSVVTVSAVAGAIRKFQVTGLSAGLHTIKITKTAGGNPLWIGPARVRNTTGVSVSNAGIFGSFASDWLPTFNTSAYYNPYNLSMGLEVPKLVLLGLGANEALNPPSGTTPANLTSRLVTIAQAAQAAGSSVVMKSYIPPADSVITAAHTGTVWADWVKAMYDAADTAGAALIDHTDVVGTSAEAEAAGLLFTDHIHPLPGGYAAVARRDFRALMSA